MAALSKAVGDEQYEGAVVRDVPKQRQRHC